MRMKADAREVEMYCNFNVDIIRRSKKCGCPYCLAIYDAKKVTDWADYGSTAKCPNCGQTTVLGDATGLPVNKEFLKNARIFWYGTEEENDEEDED